MSIMIVIFVFVLHAPLHIAHPLLVKSVHKRFVPEYSLPRYPPDIHVDRYGNIIHKETTTPRSNRGEWVRSNNQWVWREADEGQHRQLYEQLQPLSPARPSPSFNYDDRPKGESWKSSAPLQGGGSWPSRSSPSPYSPSRAVSMPAAMPPQEYFHQIEVPASTHSPAEIPRDTWPSKPLVDDEGVYARVESGSDVEIHPSPVDPASWKPPVPEPPPSEGELKDRDLFLPLPSSWVDETESRFEQGTNRVEMKTEKPTTRIWTTRRPPTTTPYPWTNSWTTPETTTHRPWWHSSTPPTTTPYPWTRSWTTPDATTEKPWWLTSTPSPRPTTPYAWTTARTTAPYHWTTTTRRPPHAHGRVSCRYLNPLTDARRHPDTDPNCEQGFPGWSSSGCSCRFLRGPNDENGCAMTFLTLCRKD